MLNIFPKFTLPEIGRNYKQIKPTGSADALFLSEVVRQARLQKRLVAIFCENLSRIEQLQSQITWLSPDVNIAVLPDWETLPYDRFSPHCELTAQRILALYKLITKKTDVVLISSTSALTRLANKEYFLGQAFWLKVGEKFNKTSFSDNLVQAGYQHVNQVISHGEWAVRGAIIDVFPVSGVSPCRIEQNNNIIESLRLFDPETQRTIHPINELNLLPAREYPFDEKAIERFRQKFRESFAINPASCPIYKDVSSKTSFAGAEYYLPFFCEYTSTIFDYLPDDVVCVQEANINNALVEFQKITSDAYESHHNSDHQRPILPVSQVFVSSDEFSKEMSKRGRISFNENYEQNGNQNTLPISLYENSVLTTADKLNALKKFNTFQIESSYPIFLWVESAGRASVIADLLMAEGVFYKMFEAEDVNGQVENIINNYKSGDNKIWLGVAPFTNGFVSSKPHFYWLTESELFPDSVNGNNRQNRQSSLDKRKSAFKIENWIRNLTELAVGDLVVHQQYGIGRYQGLINFDYDDGENEFLLLEYSNNAKLYVPITQLDLIGRFSATDNEQARLHTLGNGEWEKTLQKAERAARDMAAELLSLYALRHNKNAPQMSLDKIELEKFAEGFGFELTIDQENSIDAVVGDMTGNQLGGVMAVAKLGERINPNSKPPMDRLVCGDVGFGKTEVAMRAAFVAINNGYQVALLCPTTLLAEQHGTTFTDRFANYGSQNQIPFNIVTLSRFRSAAEQKKAIVDVAGGQVDMVIGTHRLLQKDVSFKNLGLIIIDEEHRFGVRHKEVLKKMRANSHILAMSATPIPRTLSLSLEGLRDFSVMSTPPSRRLAVKTMTGQYHVSQVRESALREFRRGGQVFFLHNEVQTIDAQYKKLSEILPEARIAVAHGQMPEKELEQIMRRFRHGEFNVLLCTTIIENGIDIPNANTILINKADRFGIAQLHQLRGRVGRSHHQAYCYLLIEGYQKLTRKAKQRLDALCASEELGAGFYLAMHDLEIRGAGEILGDSQSGTIEQVGFEFYLQMLTKASRELYKQNNNNQPISDNWEKHNSYSSGECKEVNLHTSAFIPDNYCADITERLKIYKRLASSQDENEISNIRSELGDRFGIMRDGKLPPQVESLLAVHRLRTKAMILGIYKVEANSDNINFYFHNEPEIISQSPVTPERILKILRNQPKWHLKSSERIVINVSTIKIEQRISIIDEAFALLQSDCI